MGSPRTLKECGSYSLCCRGHQEAHRELLEMPGSWTPLEMAHVYSQCSVHLTHRNPHSLQLSVHTPNSGESELQQMSCRKLAHICGPGRDHKLQLQLHPWESKREAVSTWPGVLQDSEKVYKFKNSATRGSIKHSAGLSIGLRKPQNLQQI